MPENMKKYMEIRRILESNATKVYLDDIQGLNQALKWLDIEFNRMTQEEAIEKYEYLLEEVKPLKEHNGEYFSFVRYGRKFYITISIYENGKILDMRNKKVKEYKKEGFTYDKNCKHFVKIAIV